jgi:L-ribulokinase
VSDAQQAMTGLRSRIYRPHPAAHATYKELYSLYRQMHDAFGTSEWQGNLFSVMKQLIEIRNQVRM